MADAIAVLNAGSSSVKFSLFASTAGNLSRVVRGQVADVFGAQRLAASDGDGRPLRDEGLRGRAAPGHEGAIDAVLAFMQTQLEGRSLLAVGHRVVHGGVDFYRPVRVDAHVLGRLEQLSPLAPLHQPHNLAAIRLLLERTPALPQFACFDTAFHHDMPELATAFALPVAITDRGVRRYGFHGLSYESVLAALARVDASAAAGRIVVLHLGNGASMCAIAHGHSIATTMAFTPLDGLPMGTRCGSLDPGVMLYLMDELGMDARRLERLLYHESGLYGVSGISADVRVLQASDAPAAQRAIDLFVYRAGRELGSLAAALGGLDAIVFTAGIGENSADIRARIGDAARWLGVSLDADANAAGGPRISREGSAVSAWVVPTDEEGVIATQVHSALGGNASAEGWG